MAKATTSPLIKSIHGRIGNLVFYYRCGTQCVRAYVIPRNPDTEAQRTVRRIFSDAVRSWQAMPDEEKHTFVRKARYLNMSGYNLYISRYLKTMISWKKEANITSRIYNNDISTAFYNPLPSVSKPYTKGTASNPLPFRLNLKPG